MEQTDLFPESDKMQQNPKDETTFCQKHSAWANQIKLISSECIRTEQENEEIRSRLDLIHNNQINFAQDIAEIKSIVLNGLTDKIAKKVDVMTKELCQRYDEKLKKHEDEQQSRFIQYEEIASFEWFRTWVTGLKDKLFKKVIMITFILLITLTLFHLSDKMANILLAFITKG
jgi:hypothetical protein